MNTTIEGFVADERAKIDLLRSKIQECEKRIAAFQTLKVDDDLDAALARRLHGAMPGGLQVVVGTPAVTRLSANGHIGAPTPAKAGTAPKKALNAATRQLLRFADGGDRSIDEFLTFAEQNGISKDRQSMRAFLHQYKTTYGLLSSARAGYFRLNESGIAYLRSIDQPKGVATSAA